VAAHTHATTMIIRHTVTVPAHIRDGVFIGDLYRAVNAAEDAYRRAHPDADAIPDDAMWVAGDDTGITFTFDIQEPTR
jgi:hypothetical protein